MDKLHRLTSLITMLLLASLVVWEPLPAASNLPFSKPGFMMNIPTASRQRAPYLFRAGFAGSIYQFAPGFESDKGIFVDSEVSRSMSLGFSSIKGTLPSSPVEYGLHFKKRLFTYDEISISAGLYNVIFQNDTLTDALSLRQNDVSLFAVIANEKEADDFTLNTYMGFGTGLLAADFRNSDTTNAAGIFAGFRMNTEMMEHNGGVDFIGEYDGGGLNIGVRVPVTQNYNINFGIVRIDNLPKFGTHTNRRPGFVLGMEMTVPRYTDFNKKAPRGLFGADNDLAVMQKHYEAQIDSILLVKNRQIRLLRDSVQVTMAEINRLRNEVAMLQQQTAVLKDSIQRVKLEKHVTEQNINLALKHLSRSLRYFYAGNYKEALQEVDIAIELNDNLALAYARRGSIYYKLGDIDRATINWNLALQIDPEYDDVRNILRALTENRLQTTSTLNRN